MSFPYTPIYRTVEDETVKVPAWLNDRRYYHNRGDTTFAGESSEYGDFFGLDDLFTEHPDVVDGMTEIYQAWVDFGIDGFRIDTVKHVNVEFWQVFAAGIAAQAEAAGNDDFFAFGEVFDENPAFMSRYTTEAGLQATIDFGFQARAQRVRRGPSDGRAARPVRQRRLLHRHRLERVLTADVPRQPRHGPDREVHHRQRCAAVDELLARDRLAHSLMYLSRGQPVVYYGDEQGFVGDGGDKDARQDMFPSQVGTVQRRRPDRHRRHDGRRQLRHRAPVYLHLADLSRLRSEHPALADGAQIHRYASGNAGVYAFSRIDATDEREYVVAANNSETDQTVTFDTFSERGRFRGLWPVGTGDIRSDSEGRVTVTVPALSAVVWRATSDLKHQKHAPAMYFRTPGPGDTVGGRAEVGVSVPQGGFNQVTVGVAPGGHRRRGRRSAPTTTRRTACSTT